MNDREQTKKNKKKTEDQNSKNFFEIGAKK